MTRNWPRAGYIGGASRIGLLPFRRAGCSGLVDEDWHVCGMLYLPDDGIAARSENGLATVVPPHSVVLVLRRSENLQDLADAAALAEPVRIDHDQIADVSARTMRGARDRQLSTARTASSGVPPGGDVAGDDKQVDGPRLLGCARHCVEAIVDVDGVAILTALAK
jgi:hypothetical protein